MALLKENVCLFTGFTGQITYQGKPAANAQVLVRNEFNGAATELEFATDEQGIFQFDSIYGQSKKYSLAQFVSYQEIYVNYAGQEYRIWGGGKLNGQEFYEFGGTPGLVTCELTEEIRTLDLARGDGLLTNCHWTKVQ